PQFAVAGPLGEGDLNDDRRLDPVRPQTRQADRLRERRRVERDRVEPGAQVEEQFRVEARADLAREDEVVSLEEADQQCAEPNAASLRIGEAADHELLARLALHLQPVRRPPVLVWRIEPLRAHTLPAFTAGALSTRRVA